MTKKELIDILEGFSDDTELIILEQDTDGEYFEYPITDSFDFADDGGVLVALLIDTSEYDVEETP